MGRKRNSEELRGPLRRVLDDACMSGVSMDELTVLAVPNDPYRQDTPAGHAEARWFAKHFNAAIEKRGETDVASAWRALRPRRRRADQETEWQAIQEHRRRLGMAPTEGRRNVPVGSATSPSMPITDNRAAAPTIRQAPQISVPYTYVSAGLGIEIPDVNDLAPVVEVRGVLRAVSPTGW